MYRDILKSKIHRATVTDANLNYNGSITIDPILLKLADIEEFEKVQVVNINNGQRFDTYAIKGKPEAGEICVNGAAARLVRTARGVGTSSGRVTSPGRGDRPHIGPIPSANLQVLARSGE